MKDLKTFRSELEKLDWGTGLNRDDLRLQLPQMPDEAYLRLPSEKLFVNADQVAHYLRLAFEYEKELVTPPEGAEDLGGPRAWGESTTAHTVNEERRHHGVGSGADSGNTGSGSTQTATDRAGTPYGDDYTGP